MDRPSTLVALFATLAACFMLWQYGPPLRAPSGVNAPASAPTDPNLLKNTVEYFCVQDYKRDSCIDHLLSCGMKCMETIPEGQRKKIFSDYQSLKAEKKLPDWPWPSDAQHD